MATNYIKKLRTQKDSKKSMTAKIENPLSHNHRQKINIGFYCTWS